MCASAARYSVSDPGSGNVAKRVGPQQNIWSFPPERPVGEGAWIIPGPPVTGAESIHHRAEDAENGRRDAQDGGLPRPRGGRWVRRPGVRPRRRVRARARART
ncbi:hypothetical protein D8771_01310 [Streptomyces albus]|uniref:Uncharacterized protein n=1 Tax=Streptomyces albus TaxID=1888 RepID=A0A8H1LQF0_9ACTN|nr:hypothetical protein D8771_01310 [Streptomyces albus]